MEGVKSLLKQVQELGAAEGHIKIENVEKNQGVTAVISIYDNQKPANMVLEELYAWAESNNEEVKQIIEKLEKDMSWTSSKKAN